MNEITLNQDIAMKFGRKFLPENKEKVLCFAYKIIVPNELTSILDDLYSKSLICTKRMLEDRTKSSSKYYKEIPCVLAKSLISKYQKNKRLKRIKNLVLPICGDKGKQAKIVDGEKIWTRHFFYFKKYSKQKS